MYSNTLMTSLNSRAHIGPRPREISTASTMNFRNVGTLAETDGEVVSRGAVAVHISQATEETAASGKSDEQKYAQVSGFLLLAIGCGDKPATDERGCDAELGC